MHILTSTIRFPEINLLTRDAHKLRGYFGDLFKEHSQLLHNHFEDGTQIYKYPVVQYKVVKGVPMLVGINEGAELLTSLFLKIKELNIENKIYPVYSKNIENKNCETGLTNELHEYEFETLWMALNQYNHKRYIKLKKEKQKNDISKLLDGILTGNILSFFKSINYHASENILIKSDLIEKKTSFKNKSMIAFKGKFTTNVLLPDYIGIGKSVSRGFGCIVRKF
ncbi:MAG: DNA repair protein [Ignavibacteria bacterium]|nr:DNA repair protein [Ignavibacteria bacterium]